MKMAVNSRCLYCLIYLNVLFPHVAHGVALRAKTILFQSNVTKLMKNSSEGSRSASIDAAGVAEPAPTCGATMKVTSKSDPQAQCPEECPLYSKDKADQSHCTFACIAATTSECVAHNPNAPVADEHLGICRSCVVVGCKDCSTGGNDTCLKCNTGYRLKDGLCHSKAWYAWYILFGIVGLVATVLIAWVIDLALRPVTNNKGLHAGLALRSRAKNKMPVQEQDGVDVRKEWPLLTNLCTNEVAGPGVLLQMNFQVVLVIWALVLAIVWAVLAYAIDDDLFRLGLRRAQTPRQNCIIVAWGYEKQHGLMYVKVAFCVFAYLWSFLGALYFGIRQLRMFIFEDAKNSTHKDFCAVCEGLPPISGSEQVERDLLTYLESATGQKIVGVSVCWDMAECEEKLLQVLEEEVQMRENGCPTPPTTPRETEEEHNKLSFFSKLFSPVETTFLSPTTQKIITKGRRKNFPKDKTKEEMVEIDIEKELRMLKTTNKAFVVFEHELARDDALVAASEKGLTFKGEVIRLTEAHCEPDTVTWRNMRNDDKLGMVKKISAGIATILFALFVWVVAFYLPFAYYSMSFNYAYGLEPNFIETLTFSMVVCLGNVLMYLVCAEVSDRMSFHYTDTREVCYLLLYSFACIFNVVLDLVCSYFIGYEMMVGIGMKTYSGTKLADVDSFTDRFETYGMQRELGTTLMEYSFPATFLIPFCIEPIATIYMPYRIMSYLVRTHPSITGSQAEAYLASTPMDLSRYSDVLLNVMLAALVFFFPGGFNMKMFLGLVGSHIYIYAFDHFRILRSIPSTNFAESKVDWWAQWLLCIPCATILTALVYKANVNACDNIAAGISDNITFFSASKLFGGIFFSLCDSGFSLIVKCTCTFGLHVIVHTACLVWLVPRFVQEKPPCGTEYKICARRLPGSWFTTNPVHCLRSQYIYGHMPSFDYNHLGKEHLIRRNEAIGQYFSTEKCEEEDFDATLKDLGTAAKGGFEEAKLGASRSISIAKERTNRMKEATKHAAEASKTKMSTIAHNVGSLGKKKSTDTGTASTDTEPSDKCSACSGSGKLGFFRRPCETCDGSGVARSVQVT